MRTITALAITGMFWVAACSSAATPSASVAPVPASSAAPASPTAHELQLLSGVRLDMQTACAPLRADLAKAALAGVVCRPTSDVVDRVTLYLFDAQSDLLNTYLARLATHEVQPRTNTGRCAIDRASEGAYVPGDGGPNLVPERGGCYLDSIGKAHYAATLPPFVLVELDGTVGDIAAVERWAWLGNQDQPGSPTIWRSNGPASPEK